MTETPSLSEEDLDAVQDAATALADAREDAVRFLQPGLYAVHRQILEALPGYVPARIASAELPIVIGIRSDIPMTEFAVAVRATMEWLAAAIAPRQLPGIDVIAELGDAPSERRSVTAALLHGRIVALVRRATTSAHSSVLDADVDLGSLTATAVHDALAREYGGRHMPDIDAWPTVLPYDMLDLATAKGGTASEAWAIVRSLGDCDEKNESQPTTEPAPSLDDLHGYGEAIDWARDLVTDVAAYRAGEIDWADVGSAALLVGPPGTGKTTLASAVAAAAGLSFHPASYATWQSSGDGHMGDVMAAMKATFDKAKKQAPALIFIDEIDSIGARSGSRRSADWWISIVNALLEYVDGTDRRRGVVVMAACNSDAGLDAALTRAGRLDRRIEIGLPDPAAFAAILAGHLDGNIGPDALQGVAAALEGMASGADAARIARDARRIARRDRRDVTVADVEAVAFPTERRPATVVRRVAVHEAGHAVLSILDGIVPVHVTLVETSTSAGGVFTQVPERTSMVRAEIEGRIRALLGGRAAEQVLLGDPSTGAGGSQTSDLSQATLLLRSAISIYGLGDTLAYGQSADPTVVETDLRRLYVEAVETIERHRLAVDALACLLVERRTLLRSDLDQFAAHHRLGSQGRSPTDIGSGLVDVRP